MLTLKFKYYQRLEGTIPVPPGAQVRLVTVRAFEAGDDDLVLLVFSPRAKGDSEIVQDFSWD